MSSTVWQTIPIPLRHPEVPWKQHVGQACPHGLEIVLVDGTFVRNHYDSDFSQGGNGYRYDFIPRDEIWVDAQISQDEWPFIIFHECHESMLMARGWSYGRAHDRAKLLEDALRRGGPTR